MTAKTATQKAAGKSLLTHSRQHSFKSCRRKHYYEYELGIRKVTDAKPLRMGSGGHEGLDVLKQTGDLEQALAAVRRMYADMPEGFDEWEWDIERETVECLVTGYHWRWGTTQ